MSALQATYTVEPCGVNYHMAYSNQMEGTLAFYKESPYNLYTIAHS